MTSFLDMFKNLSLPIN